MSYTNKTQPTSIRPKDYLENHLAGNSQKLKEALLLIDLYTQVTGSPCVLWNAIFGFGTYYYFDSKGGEHSYLMTGFATSKTGFTLYNLMGWERYQKDIENLGTFKLSGKSCLAIKSIDDINLTLLKEVVKKSLDDMKKTYRTES